MSHEPLSCSDARALLSARLDGEPHATSELRAHLDGCADCRAHERELAVLSHGFAALREPTPVRDLWPAIERRARTRVAPPVLLRIAAALVGFVGVGAAAWMVERADARPERHMLERLQPELGPDALFAALPEYRILRALPNEEPR